MKIGILQTGLCPDELVDEHGEYDKIFTKFLGGFGFEFEGFRVVEGDFPSSVHAADGWLVTGSKYGAYEDHAWMVALEDFLRAAYDKSVPIVGVCFGHQILAQALGGKVEKFAGGWSVGKQHYHLDGFNGGVDLMAWHQDQVTVLPPGAKAIGSSPFCQNAVLAYGKKALSMQPHPEYGEAFISGLFEVRKNVLPPEVLARRDEGLSGKLSSPLIATMIADFFKQGAA